MDIIDQESGALGEVLVHSGLVAKMIRLLFGGDQVTDGASPRHPPIPAMRIRSGEDDLGWLSLTLDADGHSPYERDVVCLGVTPDDLDHHDPDGGDLSWIGLSPLKP